VAAAGEFAFGVPAGDTYSPTGLAVDASAGLAYVYGARSDAGRPVIAVLDLARKEVVWRFLRPQARLSENGRILLSADGARGYLVEAEAETLTVFDPAAGTFGTQISDVREAALSADDAILFVLGRERLAAYRVGDLAAPVWQGSAGRLQNLILATDGKRMAAWRGGEKTELLAFDTGTGKQTASALLPDLPDAVATGPDGGWAVRIGGATPRLWRFSAGLELVVEAEIPHGTGLFHDAVRHRYILGGYRSDPAAIAPASRVLVALDERDLKPLAEATWPAVLLSYPQAPDRFVAYGQEGLLGFGRFGAACLTRLDPATLAPTERLIFGVALSDMALDAANGVLYVADDQDRIHVKDVIEGRILGVWDGAAPIEFDPAHRRLYVNRPEGVVALDATSGEVAARFGQAGVPAPDPQRDLVYLIRSGVTIYNRAGQQTGRLDDTFPIPKGLSPNPAAVGGQVNPVSGYLFAAINNGVPGSNNSTYLRIYPPQAGQSIGVPGNFSFLFDLAFDRTGGNVFASYSSAKNLEAIQLLGPTGQELRRLAGRFGWLAFDPAANALYVARSGALALLDGSTLTLRALYRAPASVEQLVFNLGTRQFYFRSASSSRLQVLNLTDLQPFDMRPQPVAGLPQENVTALAAAADATGLWLYATVQGVPYRSAGGAANWQKLPVGSIPIYGRLTVLAEGVLFYAGQGSEGGDGVWRSTDGGENWELLTAGLTDLRTLQAIAARSADEAYFAGRTGSIMAWQAAGRFWKRVLAPESEYATPADLFLASDGTLFQSGYGRLRATGDGGQAWRDLPPVPENGLLLGFDPDFGRTQKMFAFSSQDNQYRLWRSDDGGLTWARTDAGLELTSYPIGLKLAEHRGAYYLYHAAYDGPQLFRSTDGGTAWLAAPAEVVTGTTTLTVGPDGRLWFGLKGGVRSADPARIAWAAVRPPPTPSPTPVPADAGRGIGLVTAVPTPCGRPLPAPLDATARRFPELGCPTGQERELFLARQPFEHGQMVWRSDERAIYVIYDSNSWQRFADEWQEGQPETDPDLTPAAGLQQPIRGFGKMWREKLGGPRAQIGWAREREQGVTGRVQAWDGGIMFRFGSEEIVLLNKTQQ
jgi:photosystem II stability/assembly factor-like uncharacterized protein